MPRLRKVVNLKYTIDDEDLPLDSKDQSIIIENLRENVPFNKSRPRNKLDDSFGKVLHLTQACFAAINLILITHPHYRRENPIVSCFTCVTILGLSVLIHVEFIRPRELMTRFTNMQILIAVMAISATIFLISIRFYTGFLDMLFFVPFLSSLTLYSFVKDVGSLSQDILELERLKFNYKEA
ncbi:hypothetical protein KL930_001296 [Ogataea haglerorum]|uniref:Uncharacterized protein n=1 Tax=Ogataea haglerorum TaxID=1937702 RepID=A0ABQ7RG17_9ASCO|nr:hypothetical protein KL915_003206 [Ogataea haglerorum]KAG7698518.1 hypothetical protein KL951_001782 [Ogataea haglerorum]KAG7706298.1 hypothetical protein KL914_003193 [Ogataea haglerorum]KAG7737946.1 hypothetical protein KL923_003493 [Ogataea haglerorum]KAG7743647.1 hypothetical protein KL932_001712 [Ogataea haglerorum]